MKQRRCIFFAALLLASLLAGCREPANVEVGSAIDPESNVETDSTVEPELTAYTFYPITGAYQWLEGGTLLAVPDGSIIRYIGLENELIRTVELPADELLGDYQYLFSDNRILVMGRYDFGGRGSAGYLSACFTGGEWILANGSVWDRNGNPLREFPALELVSDDPWEAQLSDGRSVEGWEAHTSLEVAHWINDDLLVLDGHSRLFFYRLSSGTLTVVDDMSGWMEGSGMMQAYLGIASIMPSQNGAGCFYFAHKNIEKTNTAGTVWYADESGTRALFGGREFNHVQYDSGMLVMVDWTTEDGNTRDTQIWCAFEDDLALQELDALPGGYSLPQLSGGYISMVEWNDPYRFLIIDPSSTDSTVYVPEIEDCTQYEILGVRRHEGAQQIFYTTFIDGETGFYLYDTRTGASTAVKNASDLFLDTLNAGMTHFVALYPDRYDTTAVRVRAVQ